VKVLIGFGGDVNLKENGEGQTALMFAASFNRSEAIRILMEHGADPKISSRVIDMAAQAATRGGGAGGGGRAGGGGAGAAGAAGRGGRGVIAPGTNATAGAAGAVGEASANSAATNQAIAAGLGGATTVAAGAGAATTGDPAQATTGTAATAAAGAGAAGGRGAGGGRGGRGGGRGGGGAPGGGGQAAGGAAQDQTGGGGGGNGDDSRPVVIDFEGGLTPMLFAARQGNLDALAALADCGANVNFQSPGDKSTPLLIATINGHYDAAMFLLDHGADPNLASTANNTPLYATLNNQYAPRAFYPQPRPMHEKTSYLDLMHALLEHGADPNVKLRNKLWFTGYNFDQSGVDAKGSTSFWRAAQAADIDAMKMLVDYGADWTMPSDGGASRAGNGRGPGASVAEAHVAAKMVDGVTPLQMASGAGYDGNFQVIAPGGFLPAFKWMLETLGGDVNEADSRGYTPVHNAAFMGDNEFLKYLISKGADVKVETKSGETAVDLANGPVQRLQPFPDTIKLLEDLGVKNNHKCKSCGH